MMNCHSTIRSWGFPHFSGSIQGVFETTRVRFTAIWRHLPSRGSQLLGFYFFLSLESFPLPRRNLRFVEKNQISVSTSLLDPGECHSFVFQFSDARCFRGTVAFKNRTKINKRLDLCCTNTERCKIIAWKWVVLLITNIVLVIYTVRWSLHVYCVP